MRTFSIHLQHEADELVDAAEACELSMATKQGRSRYKLADLIAEMPDGLPMVAGWNDMPSVGRESDV